MPRVAPSNRKRVYSLRTRAGCITFRRVKCDETKPSCRKCTSTGRKCDGYPALDGPQEAPESTALTNILRAPPSVDIPGGEKERRSFHFFHQTTAPQLSGFCGDGFWDKLILQASHHEPAIRHAVIALGSLHERFIQHNGLITRCGPILYLDEFALQQYSLALKCLLEPFYRREKQAMDICLVSCVLFACFENMQGSYGLAITHIHSGSKILYEMEFNEDTKQHNHEVLIASKFPYVPIEALQHLFLRLDLSVVEMVGGRKFDLFQKIATNQGGPIIPPAFSSLSAARESLVFNWHRLSLPVMDESRFDDETSLTFLMAWQQSQQSSMETFDQWTTAFDSFLKIRGDLLTEIDRKGVAMLQIQRKIGFMSLQLGRTHFGDQTLWDQFLPLFKQIVTLATEILDADSRSRRFPTFSLDMGIVGPLYEVASRCRDPVIRRQAISLMKSRCMQEGVWNSILTAKVAERVVEIEEAGLGVVKSCSDVPDSARLSFVYPVFDPAGRKAIIKYMRIGSSNGLGRGTVEEEVEW